MNYKEIKKLVKLLKEEDLAVLSISDDNTHIHIEQKGTVISDQPAAISNNEPAAEVSEKSSELLEITAGQIGTFYNQKDENSEEVFVTVGDKIEKGDQVGFIEAMKVFNDVKSNVSGVVEEIKIDNGDAVEFGDVLLLVRPEEA
ncbi:Biotin carboxyl carrier protein of acetyl-CoA carboxylase [Jeotgalicoccus aerolatus]|jgi:acetyl-CoA carboxylase biotin carboxyl carrier protein|uniref:Biotin carboxyl carrier protein n=1 Tax=Jeotgalicoccus aerolatus TaxID=709510 RepID=A0ABS4HPH5_9STAP|nr:biotin/lipoyl-containing protein [Jeotgalicoccus aerolatus]MBP1952837.1 biotin carboxyl carrier protein [Jeotgalicoccus aerolatus]NMA81169.1 acetyl-CoA carboxylase biotin carboxyl carrier protein subunit [Jeotgalicoccus aerolatus]CAD2080555.1 Biotin carboxyl carrier protein of acetyl-CoA carboxylase [Jeotgalicoccus aerolatus]GGE07674.1 acetyl-CoA carboxylase biotin carboxyl carrier protein subunit [Jeotgalicoccus aerolatus]HJG33827.1 acetyl-CoA carboxylase biotin carboxyl carrier protein su